MNMDIHWLLESAESPGSKQLVPLGMGPENLHSETREPH